jgi:NAD(P)-dependent dehydrogenase (short-subunit alcohol dehydrogenase family)
MAQTTGKLAGKAALITGGGSGIGRGIARRFAREGATVALCGRREGPLAAVCAEIESSGGRCVVLQGDIGVETDVQRIIAGTTAALGGLDVLVNNASVVGQVGPVEELDVGRWNAALAVNLTGAMLCCREAIPHLKRGGGTIVNISSNVGRRGFRNRAPYVCAKWALHGLTQTLALELAGSGVRVNAVCPGPVLTERLLGSMAQMAAARGIGNAEVQREWEAESPMGRFATIEECAQVTLFLAGDDSSAMTGQALNVTAGVIMT